MLLKGKVAIVTGGTRGIGEAIVKEFVRQGCRVAFTFNKSKNLADKIKKDAKGKVLGYQVDIRDFEKMKQLVEDVKHRFKRLDILVNNAGIVHDKSLLLMDKKEWGEVIDTNLTGVFNATKACILTFMKQKSGNIINISSLSAVYGTAGQTNYAASKAGLIGFTKALVREVGPYNIRVNAIAPGFIQTDMIEQANIPDSFKKQILSRITLGRFGQPAEVAKLALFLSSNDSSYITGQVLIIDGGLMS